MFARRGQYGVLVALVLGPMLGVGALALDLAMVSSVSSQADAVAYVASNTAIVAYREGYTREEATEIASALVAQHPSMHDGTTFTLEEVRWGTVDKTTGTLIESATTHAAAATVGRRGGSSLTLMLAGVLGRQTTAVDGTAVAEYQPNLFDTDGCDIEFDVEGRDSAITKRDFSKVLKYKVYNTGPAGWYELYKADVAESGARQLNESSYFRIPNDTNPGGQPRASVANCSGDYIVQDYDNDGIIPDRVYIGEFYLEEGQNYMYMHHYCDGTQNDCPEFEHPDEACGDSWDSVHYFLGGALCAE